MVRERSSARRSSSRAALVIAPTMKTFTANMPPYANQATPCNCATPPTSETAIIPALATMPGTFHQPGTRPTNRYPLKPKTAKNGLTTISVPISVSSPA
jgi:hypothetical protein